MGLTLFSTAPATAGERLEEELNLHHPGQNATDIDARYRWLHWWEAHWPSILDQTRSASFAPAAPLAPTDIKKASEKLIEALDHDSAQVRYGALLALARMQHPDVTVLVLGEVPPRAEENTPRDLGLIDDPEALVREAAWAALGLTANARSREALIERSRDERSEIDAIGRMVGLGLLPTAERSELAELAHAVKNGSTDEVRRMAIWALAQHDAPEADRLIAAVVQESRNPTLSAQALAYASAHQRLNNDGWRLEVAERRRRGESITAFRALEEMGDLVVHGSTTARVGMELQTAALASLAAQTEISDIRTFQRVTRRLARQGTTEPINLTPGRRKQNDASKFEELNQLHMLRGQATLALAMQTDESEEELRLLLSLLKGETRGTQVGGGKALEQQLPEALVRGSAALGLGILSRRNEATADWALGTPVTGRRALSGSDQREIVRELAKLMKRGNEPPLLRSAAAMGLGITGRPQAIEALRSQSFELSSDDRLLGGYVALGLAIAGDRQGVALAEQLLSSSRNDFSTLLGQRAAAQALAFAGHTDAIQKAGALPDRPMWVQLAVVRAAAETGAVFDVAPLLLQLEDEDADRAWAAAYALGEVLDAEPQPRLHRLSRHVNHTTTFRRHSFVTLCGGDRVLSGPEGWPIRDFHGLSQPFLYFDLLNRAPGPSPNPGEAGSQSASR
ncbi:HEAT repeat domain-containing protein [Algisphaera agarilytica]|uniref:HEAT repeat protein n=1 Tax=Algisphaera agarilytica TaxID=1385975 RepID=A0A7X0H6R9_9BACT|nr:HEAT repeat domain-containing protein [Algisphaera agarilytica]MBB6430310.1 HEAT repeat protein [Algisphaera agarilytica]